MAQEPAKPQLQEKEQKDQKAAKQRQHLRARIRAIATSVIKGNFDKVEQPYRPPKVQDAEHSEWRTLSKNQDNLMKRIAAANDAMDGGLSKQALIVSLRGDFPDIAKKVPEPVKKPAPVAEAPPPPVAAPQQTNQQAAEKKRKQVELDDEDDQDDEEYDPDADGRAQREERAAKRQRSTGQDIPTAAAAATELKPMMDEEELEMQIQEIKMKADLAILQLRRKFAADKKKKEQMGARVKREVV
ncbi:hypothetical protein PRZ48_004636 [Zasmidium cellare]|uniref:Uncharacterized protein n=1 Tax=Zasmidium cellare TaxID=395010 RepID=A0ABR0ERG5_ZASCE|nr:hypothetical protein PRZ48_004636 [Zasmidium cellare]